MLRSRSCHSAPPTKVRFYGSKGVDILSAGENDFMVIFHVDQAYMTRIYAIFLWFAISTFSLVCRLNAWFIKSTTFNISVRLY